MKTVGISFTPASLADLDMIASLEGESRSRIVRKLIAGAVKPEGVNHERG